MPRTSPSLPLEVRRALRNVGRDIRAARLRRRLPAAIVAERADIARATLRRVERGDATVAFGTYATVLWALGMGDRINRLAATDEVGLTLDEERLPERVHLRRFARRHHRTT
jgi:transcriptional regulator with XRE-family HTH domain